MYRYKFRIEYDGSCFDSGWQKQNNQDKSVQGTLNNAAFKLTQEVVNFYCAGRTDKCVHAIAQIAHADFTKPYSLKCLQDGMNAYLRGLGCQILEVSLEGEGFHARFWAKNKTYMYVVSHSKVCSVFDRNRVWWIYGGIELDMVLIQSEAKKLLGEHDFSSFRDSSCQAKTPIKTINNITFEIDRNKIVIEFNSRSFLHKQIRIMVGTLFDIGRGRLSDIGLILNSKDRTKAGQTAPGCGLFLKSVEYS